MSDPAYRDQMMKQREASMTGGRKGAPAKGSDKSGDIPEQYTNPQSTPLTLEVKAEDNNFEIPIP
jgi:hypothetical protein